MNPYDYYLKRAQAIKDHDYRKLALIMCDHIGEDYSARKEIIQRKANLGNERDVRGMFEVLTMVYHFPVCAHSGKAGYFIPPRKSATNRTRAEIRSRGEKMFAKDRAYDQCDYPPEEPESEYFTQDFLFHDEPVVRGYRNSYEER